MNVITRAITSMDQSLSEINLDLVLARNEIEQPHALQVFPRRDFGDSSILRTYLGKTTAENRSSPLNSLFHDYLCRFYVL